MTALSIDPVLRARRSRRNLARAGGAFRHAVDLQRRGMLDQAVAILRAHIDFSNPKMVATYLRMSARLLDFEAMGDVLRAMIATGEVNNEEVSFLDFGEQCGLDHRELGCLGGDHTTAGAARQRFREAQASQLSRFTFISLGVQCHGWALLNRWGFRMARDAMATFNPFSLAVHRIDGLLVALESDFQDYFVPDKVKVIPTALNRRMAVRPDLGIAWNHHTDDCWLRNGLKRLEISLARLTGNFRQSCKASSPVFFVAEAASLDPGHADWALPRPRAALSRYCQAEPIVIIANFQNCNGDGIEPVDSAAVLLRCPYPEKGYHWADPQNYNSASGLDWEQRFMTLMLAALNESRSG